MKSIKQLMEEMGFNPNAPLSLQKAFIRHLIASANETAPPKEEIKPATSPNERTKLETSVQLEFEFPEDKRVS
ncbi:MAG: hypothetical protein KDD38_07050 [Bdellovibrionales bacterium]|nr:hypothetical protein [Bdellovibrionales bacterium]